jgi:predicted enzyme related to lactoylglutathione lyase
MADRRRLNSRKSSIRVIFIGPHFAEPCPEPRFGREEMSADELTRRTAIGLIATVALAAGSEAAELRFQGESQMERVLGIGGFFFRARDPRAIARWYADNLGVALTPGNYEDRPWRTEAGTTVFEPFSADTTYFGDARLQWMINFRVANLARMVAQLNANGITVEVDPETYPNGRFAKLHDPEGNPIQLWEPAGVDPG